MGGEEAAWHEPMEEEEEEEEEEEVPWVVADLLPHLQDPVLREKLEKYASTMNGERKLKKRHKTERGGTGKREEEMLEIKVPVWGQEFAFQVPLRVEPIHFNVAAIMRSVSATLDAGMKDEEA